MNSCRSNSSFKYNVNIFTLYFHIQNWHFIDSWINQWDIYIGPLCSPVPKKTRGISHIWVRNGSMVACFPQKFSGKYFKGFFRKNLETDHKHRLHKHFNIWRGRRCSAAPYSLNVQFNIINGRMEIILPFIFLLLYLSNIKSIF